MTLNVQNAIVLTVMGAVSMIAQATGGEIASSLIQFGAIGVILAWITLVDIPQRNKASERREDAHERAAKSREESADKAASAREAAWKEQLEAERRAATTRQELFHRSLERLADVLDRSTAALDKLSSAVDGLSERERTPRK